MAQAEADAASVAEMEALMSSMPELSTPPLSERLRQQAIPPAPPPPPRLPPRRERR